jgi:NADH dehydrogenase FAD-containing subunit
MSSSSEHNRESARRTLARSGIKVTLKTSVKDVREDSLTLIDESGEEYSYAADLVIFTAGTEQSPFVRAIDAEKDRFGRLVTRDTLQLKDFPNVFSLGDCSSVEGQQNPSTAQGKGAVCVCLHTPCSAHTPFCVAAF